MTETTMVPTVDPEGWIRDGHTMRIFVDCDAFYAGFVCPVDGREPVDADRCRIEYDAHGAMFPGAAPSSSCNFAEGIGFNSCVEECLDSRVGTFEILTAPPLPVAVRWEDTFGGWVWAPTAWVDAQATGGAE